MTFKLWFTNRVIIGMLVFFVTMGFWEFKWKPQYRPAYESGVAHYQKGQYQDALDDLNKAYSIAPNALDVIVMLGWTNLKLNHWEEARFYFNRAIRIDPRTEEAQLGASFVALETGHGRIDPQIIDRILKTRKGDPNVLILAAAALEQEGEYVRAAQVYKSLLKDKDYGEAATLAYYRIYGLQGFEHDTVAEQLPPVTRAAQLTVPFRAADGAMWRNNAGNWEKWYIDGVDLGPGAPGYYPVAPPTDGALYAGWIKDASELHADALRAYVLLPPSFYRAFRHYRDAGGKMSVIQQIWIGQPPDNDLYTPAFVEMTKDRIRQVVDAIHGRGEVPITREQSSGIYDQDISAAVAAYLIGGDFDQNTYLQTNIINGGKTRFSGRYVSIDEADASEVWYAEMMDYLVSYESSTYNWQRPVAIAGSPSHDPARGAVTEEKLRASSGFAAGLFAAYDAFPYYPESLVRDPQYLNARDSEGLNPMYGYLRMVRSRISLPLVVTGFGMSTSIAVRRAQVNGWDQGGHSEADQADRLLHLRRTVQETGCAGGIVFELADEWYRQGWMREGFETPEDRAMLWLNDLDPSKRYGLIGYRTSKWQLFGGGAWKDEHQLYGAVAAPALDNYDKEREIRSVQVAADEAYMYLSLNVGCLDCVGTRHDGKTHFDEAAYAIAINTLPGRAGLRALPFGNRQISEGANFLLFLGDGGKSRLLVADNYNPYEVVPRTDYPNEQMLHYRHSFEARLETNGNFLEFPMAYGESPSVFHYGDGNPTSKEYNSSGEWYADVARSTIFVRIPWGKLLVVDPSRMNTFYRYAERSGVSVAVTPGVDISVYTLKTNGSARLGDMTVASVLPSSGTPAMFSWDHWDKVAPKSYYKQAYFALQSEFSKATPVAGVAQKPAAQGR